MAHAITQYKEHLLASGKNKQRSAEDAVYRLGKYFTNDQARLRTFSPAKVQALYDELATRPRLIKKAGGKIEEGPPLSADSRLDILAAVKAFFGWCTTKALVSSNPAKDIKGDAVRNHGGIGRSVLMPKELRKLFVRAHADAEAGDDRGVGILMALLLGMRSSEIVHCQARDVDDEGDWTLTIPVENAKTKASARKVVVPEVLRPHLSRCIKGKRGDQYLFATTTRRREDDDEIQEGPHWRDWVSESTGRLCRALGIPEESAHGLRGAHNDLARSAGNTAQSVLEQLGHESESTARRSYTSETGKRAISAEKQGRVLSLMSGGKAAK